MYHMNSKGSFESSRRVTIDFGLAQKYHTRFAKSSKNFYMKPLIGRVKGAVSAGAAVWAWRKYQTTHTNFSSRQGESVKAAVMRNAFKKASFINITRFQTRISVCYSGNTFPASIPFGLEQALWNTKWEISQEDIYVFIFMNLTRTTVTDSLLDVCFEFTKVLSNAPLYSITFLLTPWPPFPPKIWVFFFPPL